MNIRAPPFHAVWSMAHYVFQNPSEQERRRLAFTESIWDSVSIERLEALGVSAGWRCLEVGAGSGSIARWLAHRVGEGGEVVATDIDTRMFEQGGCRNLEILRHDITSDELAEDAFDVVHARMVLAHISSRPIVIRRMVSALRPGGRLLIEDFDWLTPIRTSPSRCLDMSAPHRRLFARVTLGILKYLMATGVEPEYGRRLPSDLMDCGLEEVSADGRCVLIVPSTPGAELFRLSVEQLRTQLVTLGFLTEREVQRALAVTEGEEWAFMSPVLVGAWGRKPGTS